MKKLYIFDLDGTLYDLNDLIAFNFKQEKTFLMDKLQLSDKEATTLLINNHIYPDIRADAQSCSELFERLKLDLKQWNQIRSSDFPVELINKTKAVKTETLKKYQSEGYLALISNNTRVNILKILNRLEIPEDSFDLLLSKEDNSGKDKTIPYLKALDYFSIQAENTLVVGDRYHTDLLPLLKIGGMGVLVRGPEGVNDYIEERSGKSYQVFKTIDDIIVS